MLIAVVSENSFVLFLIIIYLLICFVFCATILLVQLTKELSHSEWAPYHQTLPALFMAPQRHFDFSLTQRSRSSFLIF